MYYTEKDPRTGKKVYVPKNPHEKAMQRALMQYRVPSNYDLVKEALIKAGREDLIGYSHHCLIRPEKSGAEKNNRNQYSKSAPKRNEKRTGSSKNNAASGKKKTIRNVHKKSR